MLIQNNTCKRRFHNSYGEFPFADNKKAGLLIFDKHGNAINIHNTNKRYQVVL